MLIDISPRLEAATPVWPGDRALTRDVALSLDAGDNLDLSSVQTTVHIGAHADAPSHYASNAATIDQVDLSAYIGPCSVITVKAKDLVPATVVAQIPGTCERVLFRSDSFQHQGPFSENFCAIAPETIAALAAKGCRLVGIDTPSVDPFASKTLDCHQALKKFQLLNLEGLDLSAVDDGEYELIALPLKLIGFDASPVRAVLRPLQ